MDAALQQYAEVVKREAPEELTVAREELAGHIQAAEGKVGKGLKTLDNASKMQRKLRYSEPSYYPQAGGGGFGRSRFATREARDGGSGFSVLSGGSTGECAVG